MKLREREKEIMKVANRCKDKIKTERQWNIEGFKVKAECEGEKMWTNQFCGNISMYFRETEVEEMNPEELMRSRG